MVRLLLRLLLLGSVLLLLGAGGMAVVMLVGLGAGACLNLLAPSIDLGSATIAGVLALLTVFFAFGQYVRLAIQTQVVTEPSDDEDSDDALSEEQVEDVADRVADRVADAVVERIATIADRRNRRSRSPTRSK